MLLDNSPPNSIYNDIQNNFINEMTLRQFIKMKDKFGGDDSKAYEIATLDFNDFLCFKEMPSFDIIKQLYINQLPNKNEGQLCNKSTDSIIDLSEKLIILPYLKKYIKAFHQQSIATNGVDTTEQFEKTFQGK